MKKSVGIYSDDKGKWKKETCFPTEDREMMRTLLSVPEADHDIGLWMAMTSATTAARLDELGQLSSLTLILTGTSIIRAKVSLFTKRSNSNITRQVGLIITGTHYISKCQ